MEWANCSRCGKQVLLTKHGKIRTHTRFVGEDARFSRNPAKTYGYEYCPGNGSVV